QADGWETSESMNELLGQTMAEIVVLGIATDVDEWQNDERIERPGGGFCISRRAERRRRVDPSHTEPRDVLAVWQLDQHGVAAPVAGVVVRQLRSNPAGLNPHDRIIAGVIGRRIAVEDLYADHRLLDLRRAASESLLGDEAKKSFQPLGFGEIGTRKNAANL